MTNYKKFSGVFFAVFLSGCASPSIIKTSSSTGNSICKLVNAQATMVRSTTDMLDIKEKRVLLGVAKLSSNHLIIWIEVNPSSSKEAPLDTPGIILKTYKGDTPQEYKQKGSRDFALGFSSASKKVAAFTIPIEQFNNILESDMTQILIQTNYDPIVIKIEKEDFVPFQKFNQECLG